MAVLMILADRPRRVCTREYLLDAVWGSDREAYDRVLDNAISDLRRAFGDSPRAPLYIETITKQGYRLIAEVEWPDVSSPPLSPVGFEASPEVDEDAHATDAAAGAAEPTEPEDDEVAAPGLPEQETAGSASGLEVPPVLGPARPVAEPRVADRARPRVAARSRPWWRRLGIFGLLLSVLFAAAGWVLTQRVPSVRISLEGLTNNTGDIRYDDLEKLLLWHLEHDGCPGSRIGIRNLSFLSGTRVRGEVARRGDHLVLSARLSGRNLPTAGSDSFKVSGPEARGHAKLVAELADEIRLRLDRFLCDAAARAEDAEGCHCLHTGRRALAERQLATAERYLKRAIQASPDCLEAHDLLVGLYVDSGRYKLAEEALVGLATHADSEVAGEQMRLKRRRAQVELDFRTEHEALLELQRLEPENTRWPLALGAAHLKHRRACQDSLAALEEAQIRGEPRLYLGELGRTHWACGHLPQAEAALDSLVRLRSSPDALVRLAELKRLTGRYEQAGDHLARALTIQSDYPPAVLEGARIDLATGRLEQASAKLSRYLGLAPWALGRHDGFVGLARVALQEGDAPAAGSWARRALEAMPESVEPLWLQGLVAVQAGDLDAARDLAEQIRSILEQWGTGDGLALYHHLSGQILVAAGDAAGAVSSFDEAVRSRPLDRAYFLHALAGAFEAAGDDHRALEVYGELQAVNPGHAPALCSEGALHQRQGDLVRARELYRQAFEFWNDVPGDEPMRRCAERLKDLETVVGH